MLPCELYIAIGKILQLYVLVLLVYALVSWVPSIRGRWTDYLGMLVEPVLAPVRRIIPPIGGLDMSFLVLIIVVQVVIGLTRSVACTY
jgi:YggT family protein